MRIGVLTSLYPGPTRPQEGIFAERRWLGMCARGHAVRVVQPMPLAPPLARGRWAVVAGSPAREQREEISVHRPRYLHLPTRPRWLTPRRRVRANARRFAAVGLRSLTDGFEPEVVVCDFAWPAAAAAPGLQRLGLACVVSGRGGDVLEVAGEAGLADELAGYLKIAGHWCAVSRDLVGVMDRLAGAPGRGVLVPNGVDLERFRPADRSQARARLGLEADGALVLVVGHLIDRKDPSLALQAFQRGAPEGARLVFLGRGELASKLRAVEDPRVSLRGEVSHAELADWYAASDLLLLTSRREGRPNVVLEALASGRPVLATSAGGTQELLAEAPEMLAEDRDPAALGRGLAALLAAPPAPQRCRGLVQALDWDSSLDALEGVLGAALGVAAG